MEYMDISSTSKYGVDIKGNKGVIAINPVKTKNGHIFTLQSFSVPFDDFTKETEGLVFDSAGEYEVEEVIVEGVQTKLDKQKIQSTSYMITMEGIKILYISPTSNIKDLLNSFHEDKVDISIISISKYGDITAKEAKSIANNLQASILIPIGDTKEFKDAEKTVKFSVKKKELEADTQKTLIFN